MVQKYGYIRMQLQHRGRNFRGYRAFKSFLYNLCLVCPIGKEQNPACLHDGFYTHGQSLTGHLIRAVEESGVGINGAFG